MRDIRDKVTARFFDAFDFRDVMEDSYGAALWQRGDGDVKCAAGDKRLRLGSCDLVLFQSLIQRVQEVGITNSFDSRHTGAGLDWQKSPHQAAGPLKFLLGREGDYAVLHAVEQRLQLAATAFKRTEALFQFSRGLVERGGNLRDFVEGILGDACGEVAGGNLLRETHNALQTCRNRLRCEPRDDTGQQQRERGVLQQRSANL